MSKAQKEPKAKTKPADNPDSEKPNEKTTGSSATKTKADGNAPAKMTDTDVTVKAIIDAEAATEEAEAAEAAAKAAITKAENARATAETAAEAAAEAEYKAITDKVKDDLKGSDYTFKRQGEEIFRREMGEPEFFLHKQDRFPVPILSQERQAELTRQVEIPVDSTPKYVPQNILSPEYGGLSNYESGIDSILEDAKTHLEELQSDPDATLKELKNAKHRISYLESLYENYFLGMNVFRTAKGGRNKIKP